LVLGGIGFGEGGAIDGADAQPAPEIAGGQSGLRFGDEGVVDFGQPFEGELVAGLAVGTGFIRGLGPFVELAEVAGLADGLPAGLPGLGDLPEEGPEDQAEVPNHDTGHS
jgi:hypothetical protein